MQELDISQNYLSGTIPRGLEQLSGNLQAMRFARNNLEGVIPETLASLTVLRELVVSTVQATPLFFRFLDLRGHTHRTSPAIG